MNLSFKLIVCASLMSCAASNAMNYPNGLWQAAANLDVKGVQRELATGTNPNQVVGQLKQTIMHALVRAPSLLRFWDFTDKYTTCVQVARLLIGAGAKLDVLDSSGKTPTDIAFLECREGFLKIYLEHGGRVNPELVACREEHLRHYDPVGYSYFSKDQINEALQIVHKFVQNAPNQQ